MDSFLQWQLVFYRSGRRHNEIMEAATGPLEDADVRNLGAYYASLPPVAIPPGPDPAPGLSATGAAIAATHHCANCHTDSFGGARAAARVARQREDYLVKALADYRSGARPSTGVAAMNEAASGLADSDIAALAHYLAYLPPSP
jgi:cytochrome c553